MTDPTTADTPRPARKTNGDLLQLLAFTIHPGHRWDVDCDVAALPDTWINRLETAWRQRPGVRPDSHLPTISLRELLIGIDPAIMHVHWDLRSDTCIVAFPGVDPQVVTEAIASWATTEISADPDWYTLLTPHELPFTRRSFNLLEYTVRANGTAAPAPHVYQMLPSFLAKTVVDEGLDLLGKTGRSYILGPPQTTGRRAAVIWPPQDVHDKKNGPGQATVKIEFHVETIPNWPVPVIHADASVSRFPVLPVTYVPARGDGPPAATIWLHGPQGFLGRDDEPHTLLAARTSGLFTPGRGRQWQWSPGLARALAQLTQLSFPDPAVVMADPALAADLAGTIRPYVLYSEGTKTAAPDADEAPQLDDDGNEIRRSKSVLHAANTGLVPGDHIDVHDRLGELFAAYGIHPVSLLEKVRPPSSRLVKVAFDPTVTHTIELWTQNDVTRDAVLATLQHHLNLARHDESPETIRFTGKVNVTVLLRSATQIAAGIKPDPEKKKTDGHLVKVHTNRLVGFLGESHDRVGAIVELEGPGHFQRAKLIDPKKALKKAFGRTNRRLQCLQPAKTFTEPRSWPENSKRPKPTPYPGTIFGTGTIERAAAAINDCLRQLGHFGPYELPTGMPEVEQVGIWLHHDGNTCVPIVIRQQVDGVATAYLAATDGTISHVIDYIDLPCRLAEGKGRIGPGPKQKRALSTFLTNVLGAGNTVEQHTHDRIVYVRAAGFRNWGWDWMQDKHLRPDALILPGIDIDDDSDLPEILSPEKTPGLRILRIRDTSSRREVARGFTHDLTRHHPRMSGLFRHSDRVFYTLNPKPDQQRTPNDRTKLDPDISANFTSHAANPNPVEICIAHMQPTDNPATLATLAGLMRRAHAHTRQATTYPGVLHLCSLAEEYL